MNNTYQILLFLLPCLMLINSCDLLDERIAKPVDKKFVFREPDQSGNDIEVRFIDSGYTKAILNSDKGRIYQEQKETFLDDNVRVEFFSKYNGNRISRLTADSVRIDDVTKNMTARGNVIVKSDSSGNKLETSILDWNNQTQRIFSNEFVRITTANEIIIGYGFESDQSLSNYKINKVSGTSYRNK